MGASTSWNPQGLSKPVMGLLYLLLTIYTHPSVLNDLLKVTYMFKVLITVLLMAQVMWGI
jgi:hypothetical protein